MIFCIIGNPVTKKNSQRIIYVRNGNRRFPRIIPSEAYERYERECAVYMPCNEAINRPINIQAVFYMRTHRRVDLVNLQEALLDVLVKYRVIEDDNSTIVVSMDGSYVDYDKDHPRTEVTITDVRRELH